MITVAPNGARKTKTDHPSLPLTPQELAQTAKDCLETGAAMMHLHVRDDQGKHSLEPDLYLKAMECVKQAVGDELVLQITSEACGVYTPEQQMAAMRQLHPESMSLAINEFVPDQEHEAEAARFFHWVSEREILPQYIVYSTDDLKFYQDLLYREIVPATPHLLLFVLGKYATGQQSRPDDLLPFLDVQEMKTPWAVCAFGKEEYNCMKRAIASGGHARVGFENNLYLSDGQQAKDNAALVHQLANAVLEDGYTLATADDVRSLFSA